jgi:hypothetical protein
MNLRGRISELRKLATSDDWWDREIAGFALRDFIEDHFVEGMKLTSRWPKHPSARIRRAACQSLMQRKPKTTDKRLPPILRRLEVLMTDDDIYVRKCCGPYVVAYLAYTYPRIVIPWLKDQTRSTDLNVRANVASELRGGTIATVPAGSSLAPAGRRRPPRPSHRDHHRLAADQARELAQAREHAFAGERL